MSGRGLVLIGVIAGCSAHRASGPHAVTAVESSAQASAEQGGAVVGERAILPAPSCGDGPRALRVEGGTERGTVCVADAKKLGLVIVDLSDRWTPTMFAPSGDQTPTIRASYLATAQSTGDDEGSLQELYGVVPSLAVARARLADDARHACHAAVADTAAIAKLARPWSQDDQATVKVYEQTRVAFAASLERARAARKLPDLAAVGALPQFAQVYAKWQELDAIHAGLVAVQQHFACEHLLDAKYVDGQVTWRTGTAAELYQRRHFLMPNQRVDQDTRDALALDSRELDYRLALRVLREHVVDATGLLEDGTASTGPVPVLGRYLDPAPMRGARGSDAPLPDGAPDLVDAFTEAAAKQLGWTGPAETRAFLERHPGGAVVALALPPVPAYHATHMALDAVVDRGDVFYDETPIPRRVAHRPTLTLFVDDHGTRRALVRWPTTIGGWADQRTGDGEIVQQWKESDVGPRVWRDLYAGPTWFPPKTTPDKDLVKNLYNGKWGLKKDLLGPGPHAAFGMSLLVHHQVFHTKDGDRFDENGIGTHGSASVTSIVNGTSHGCHRLYNQLAVRLGDFLLQHRDHAVRGEVPEHFARVVNAHGTFLARLDTRGFLYELTPPVPVEVTRGRILSARKVPPTVAVAKPAPVTP